MVLLEIKTITSTRDPDLLCRWSWQLLGYAGLDPADRDRIRAVGLYLARPGVLISWPLGRYTAALLEGRDPRRAAAAFRRLAARLITSETRRPTDRAPGRR